MPFDKSYQGRLDAASIKPGIRTGEDGLSVIMFQGLDEVIFEEKKV